MCQDSSVPISRPLPLSELIRPVRYPRSSTYDPAWLIALDMGPNPLWQLEDLLPDLALDAGHRVLDLGSGMGATSVFLVKECDVDVVAVDLWVDAPTATGTFVDAGVGERVTAVQADVRKLPFSDGEFDAIVSIDAFEYFGTDVHLLPKLVARAQARRSHRNVNPGAGDRPLRRCGADLCQRARRMGGRVLALAAVVAPPLGIERSP